jgi:hypothetical protein
VGHVGHEPPPEGVVDIVPELARQTRPEYDVVGPMRGPLYVCCYSRAEDGLRSGRSAEEIRAELRPLIEALGELADVVREAVDDAVAGRPPRFEKPF